MAINGTDDRMVPWREGDIYFGRLKLGKKLSVPDTVKCWVTHNKCSTKPEVTWLANKDTKDGTQVRREIYCQGREGTEVIFYVIEGGGHTWPGGYQYLSRRFIGKTNRDINANEIIWDFFKRHKRK